MKTTQIIKGVLKIQFLILLILFSIKVSAQNEDKPVRLGLLPYSIYPDDISSSFAELLIDDITDVLEQGSRFVIINKAKKAYNDRLLFQRQDINEMGQIQGVEYLISLHFNKMLQSTRVIKKTIKENTLDVDIFYSDVQFSIRIYDVTTGELRANEIVFISSGETDLVNVLEGGQPNIEYEELLKRGYQAADKQLRKNVKKKIKWHFDKLFPFQVNVKDIMTASQLESFRVLVDGGTNIGITKKGYYSIYTYEGYNVGGETIKRKVNLAKAFDAKNLSANSAELRVFIGKNVMDKAFNEGKPLFVSPMQSGLEINPLQDITVAISPIEPHAEIYENDLGWLEEFVTNSIVAHGRFKVVERKNLEVISEEREAQKTEAYLDAEVIQQGKSLGADYMVFAQPYEYRSWYHIKKETLDPPSGYYTAFKVGIKFVDVATGEVKIEKVIPVTQFYFTGNAGYPSMNSSQDNALYVLKEKMNRLILQAFPLELEIVEVSSASKKGEAKKVLINGGSAYGLHMRVTSSTVQAVAGTPFEVFEIKEETIEGKVLQRLEYIGEIVLKDVENDLISECKVRKGGDVIFKNFESGKKMVCRIKESVISD